MYKLLLTILMMGIWLMLHTLQVDEEMAMTALYQGKHAVNRAAHAAAQQLEKAALAEGILRIDPSAAAVEAARYLQWNLQLDPAGHPLPDSYWRNGVQLAVFEIINEDKEFPYTYRNSAYQYEVTLHNPGVIMIVKLTYPRVFSLIRPIEWEIKGAAELVAG